MAKKPIPLTAYNRTFYRFEVGRNQSQLDLTLNRFVIDVLEPAGRRIVEMDVNSSDGSIITLRTELLPPPMVKNPKGPSGKGTTK